MKGFLILLLACLHLNSWMLVPHVQQDSPSSNASKQSNDLSTFFEYVDEIVLSHTDQLPDEETQDEQLTEVSNENPYSIHYTLVPRLLFLKNTSQLVSKIDTAGDAASVHIEIFAPPPNLV